MAAFVVADILDGVVLRKVGLDTPARRTADALTDRASVFRVGSAVYQKNPESRKYLGAILARDMLVGVANYIHHKKTGEVTQGTGIHKLGTLSLACFGVVAANGGARATNIAGTIATGIYSALAVDYVRNVNSPPSGSLDGIQRINMR